MASPVNMCRRKISSEAARSNSTSRRADMQKTITPDQQIRCVSVATCYPDYPRRVSSISAYTDRLTLVTTSCCGNGSGRTHRSRRTG